MRAPLRRCKPPLAVSTAIVLFALPSLATASPGMGFGQWTSPDLTFGECMSRAPKALRAEGLSAERYSRIWFGASSGPVSATIVCYRLAQGAVVTIEASNEGNSGPSGAMVGRLADRIFTTETPTPTPGSAPIPQTPTSTGPGSTPAPASTGVGWDATTEALRGKNGQRFTFSCPPGGPLGKRLYGTDSYTDDSSVCTAGVFAGVITFAKGGSVTVEIQSGKTSYPGSTQNGITSATWGTWSGSFGVVRP
jgi:hypothetical protein